MSFLSAVTCDLFEDFIMSPFSCQFHELNNYEFPSFSCLTFRKTLDFSQLVHMLKSRSDCLSKVAPLAY